MDPTSNPGSPRPAGRGALALYVVAWALTGGIVAAALLFALQGGGDDGDVSLPPVRETELTLAAQRAGCELRTGRGRAGDEPPVDGPPATPARAGVYDEPPPTAALVAALRRGVVVISYRRDLPDEQRDELRELQTAVPAGTIVTPNDRMPFVVAVTAWRQRLGCRRIAGPTRDALQLFRGRFVGSGPDSPP